MTHPEEEKQQAAETTPVTTQRSPRQTWMFLGICLLALTLVVSAYANSLHNSFHFDDDHVIETNLYIRSLNNIPSFFTDARTFSSLPANATYRPVVTLSLALDYWLGGGLDPWQFHLSQLMMLIILGMLLFFFFLRILHLAEPRWWNRYVALLAAALFSVHTANSETVNYISARSELLSTMGVVASFLVYLYLPQWRCTYLYVVPMIVGALAKSPAIMFAPLLLVYVLFFEKRLSAPDLLSSQSWPSVRGAVRVSLPVFILGIALLVFLESMNAPSATYGGGDRLHYLLTQSFVWLHYGRLFFLPVGLTADTDVKLFSDWYDTRVAAGLLFLALLLRVLWSSSRTTASRPVAFGLAWFGIALVPASSLFPLAEVANEHRALFPYIGLSLAVVWWLALQTHKWAESQARLRPTVLLTACTAALVLLCGHAVETYERNEVWHSEETLWRDVVQKSPTNGRALMNYGLTQLSQAKYAQAKALFEQAKIYTPNYWYLETNLGIVSDKLGEPAVAEQHFIRALQLQPDFVGGHYFYARWLVDHGRSREAIPHLQRAIELSPGLSSSRALLMSLYFAQGADADLSTLIQGTFAIASADPVALAYAHGEIPIRVRTPSAQGYYNQGVALTNEGRHLDAALNYRQALKFAPISADAYNNLGWALAKLGFYQEAIAVFAQALHVRPEFALAQNNLAWVKTQLISQK